MFVNWQSIQFFVNLSFINLFYSSSRYLVAYLREVILRCTAKRTPTGEETVKDREAREENAKGRSVSFSFLSRGS